MTGPKINKNSSILLGVLLLVILVGADLLVHRHPHFSVETIPLFFPLLGFLAVVILSLLAASLRRLLGRKRGYYDN